MNVTLETTTALPTPPARTRLVRLHAPVTPVIWGMVLHVQVSHCLSISVRSSMPLASKTDQATQITPVKT